MGLTLRGGGSGGGGAVSSVNSQTGVVVLGPADVGADAAGAAAAAVGALVIPSVPNEVEIVVYASGTGVGVTRPGAEFVVWQGFPTEPTNMADGDLWLSDLGGTILSGSGAPTSGDGANGDFWIRTSNSTLYGPKASGAWGSGVSLVGTNGTNGTNGRGITSIARTSGTGAAGTTDTYTITYSDATTSTFTVVNGADGAGSSITVKDEGSALSTAASSIDFVGAGVTATGTGAAKTVTIPGGTTSGAGRGTNVMPTGATFQTLTRSLGLTQQGVASGTLNMQAIDLPAGAVITSISARTGGTSSVALTHSWAGLFDSSGVALSLTPDNTANWSGATTRTFTLDTPQTISAAGTYYLGLCVAASTTMPQPLGFTGNTNSTGIPPISTATSSTGQTTPPALPFTAATLVVGTLQLYLWTA